MIIAELFQILNENQDKKISFRLGSERILSGDLHITEVKNVLMESMDCGSNSHVYRETHIQLWINESSSNTAIWTGGKMGSILTKAGVSLHKDSEREVFFEFGDSKTPTSKYSVSGVQELKDDIIVDLKITVAECKPRSQNAMACC